MNSIKKTLTLLSFALLGVSFFATTKVQAKVESRYSKHYVLILNDRFTGIDGTYNVHIHFNEKYQVDFNFSITKRKIVNITGTNADHVTLEHLTLEDLAVIAHDFLIVEVSSAVGHAKSSIAPTITITGTDGALKGVKVTATVGWNPWFDPKITGPFEKTNYFRVDVFASEKDKRLSITQETKGGK